MKEQRAAKQHEQRVFYRADLEKAALEERPVTLEAGGGLWKVIMLRHPNGDYHFVRRDGTTRDILDYYIYSGGLHFTERGVVVDRFGAASIRPLDTGYSYLRNKLGEHGLWDSEAD